MRKQLLYLVSVVVLSVSVLFPASATSTFSSYSLTSGYSNPQGITAAGGSLWYLESKGGYNLHIGNITTTGVTSDYDIRALASDPNLQLKSLTTGSDGNVWFNGISGNSARVGFLNISTGTVTTYGGGGYSYGSIGPITTGADGNLWYTTKNPSLSNYTYTIKVVPSTGAITSTLLTNDPYANYTVSLASAPNGSLWASDDYIYNNKVRSINIGYGGGALYSIPNSSSSNRPGDIVAGPDGNMWITTTGGKILKSTTSGVFTEYNAPTGHPGNLVAGNDGNVWFTDGGKVVRITSSGAMTEYTASNTAVNDMTLGPDNALWFTYTTPMGVAKVGRLAVERDNQTVSFTSTAPTGVTVDSPDYTPTAVSTSGLPVAITVDSSSSSVCSIDGSGKVSYQSTGTCTLNANQAGNIDYKPATQVQQSFTVLPVNADTSVALDCPSTVSVGSTATCTVTITNDGPATANDVNLTAVFPSSLTSPSLSGGGTISGQTITWSAPSLASGASTTLTFSATAGTVGKVRFNAALVQTSPDPSTSNNITEATIVAS